MRFGLIFTLLALCLAPSVAGAQTSDVVVDYNNPKKYIIGGVTVEGNHYFSEQQIIQLTGMQEGMELTIPGDDVSNIVKRLWLQRYFEDVALNVDHLSADGDSAYFKISIIERPRVSRWTFTGVKSGEQKDLKERLNLRRGGEFSDYVEKTSCDIIKRFYFEKGFLNCEVKAVPQKDTVVKNAIRVNFAVDRGEKIKIKEINFIGNDNVKDFKIAKQMKKTKSAKIYNFFSSKKFNEKEYKNDKKMALSAFNEAGYRDARLVKDSIYMLPPKKEGKKPNRLGIDLTFEEGDKYYFRDISWTGNSVYTTEALNQILAIEKGDVYDQVSMNKRLKGGGKQNEYDVSKLYRDNGYLFFGINPVETNIQNDSVDVEIRISEGKQATLNNIIINGNDLTNERVVRRQIFTRPGYLFSQSDFERSVREIASLGQFDPEAIMGEGGYSIIPNELNSTVDLVYNVTEKPSSQLELSGGWGGNTFVATVGVSFNNFSTRRIFDKSAWKPVPLGDAQNLAFRFQTNGTYYTALTASFTEPWLFGKKPTSLNLSAYYTRQTNSLLALSILSHDRQMEVYGFSASLGKRLKWPDNYFVLYNGLSWQTYKLTNWYSGYFIFDDGLAHNLSYTLNLMRNSTDQQIYPRQGSDISASVAFTPPYSLMRKFDFDKDGKKIPVDDPRSIDYSHWSSKDRYKWIEYHKWKFSATTYNKLIGDLVLMTRAQFGYLGYYNRKWGYSPFEGFLVGGDGMSGYSTYGSEVISLRGYENYSLTPYEVSAYNSNGYAYAGNVYDKFTVELRYPVILQPQSTIFVLGFAEAGNCWSDIRKFNPFIMKRSAGVGVRIFLPMVGLLGVDWGYGFDDKANGGSQFHFVIGQQF
ncbi:MAG: outer membrane protein assembly factor BamA [Bacteroidales bacterium]|nr:outer membrane protein assembly factor BamA [Candidatus Cryptobacteroides choladohippi]MCQ2179156.1 outer membrane protein assembly factor BamA [Bacteroidales bacterium]